MKNYLTALVLALALASLGLYHMERVKLQTSRAAYANLLRSYVELKVESEQPIPVEITRDHRGRLWLQVGRARTEITGVCSVRT